MTSQVSLLSSQTCWRQWTRCWQMTLPVWWHWFLRKPQTLMLKVWTLANSFLVFFILVLSECFVLFSHFLCALTSELFCPPLKFSILFYHSILIACCMLYLCSLHSLSSLLVCNIWGSFISMVGDLSLPGYDAVSLGEWLSTFQGNVLPFFSIRHSKISAQPWRRRQHDPLNCWEPLTQRHCITPWRTSIHISSSSLCVGTTGDFLYWLICSW